MAIYYRAVNFRPTTPTYRVVGRARSGGRRHNRNPLEGSLYVPLEGAQNWRILSCGNFRPTTLMDRVFRCAPYGGSRHPRNPPEGMRSYPLEGAQRRATLQCSRKRTHHTDIQWVCTVNRHKTLTVIRAPYIYRYICGNSTHCCIQYFALYYESTACLLNPTGPVWTVVHTRCPMSATPFETILRHTNTGCEHVMYNIVCKCRPSGVVL